MPQDDRRERGLAKFEEVMGFAAPDREGDVFLDATVDHLFADVWARPGLSVRERRLVTLTVLACLGNESPLQLHLRAAMKKDLDAQELEELMLHITHYAGWPVGAVGFGVLRKMKAEQA